MAFFRRAKSAESCPPQHKEHGSRSPAELYDAGFALAQAGRLAECLHCWHRIPSYAPEFVAQKNTLAALLIRKWADRLVQEGDPLEQVEEIRQQLDALTDFALDPVQITGRDELVSCCQSLHLVRLWQEGRNREILQTAAGQELLHPTVLEIRAKAAYQVLAAYGAQTLPAEVRQFIDCWLSALFHPAVLRTLPGGKGEMGEKEEQRQKLLALGRNMVCRYAGQQQADSGKQFTRQWEEELALLEILQSAALPPEAEQTLPVPSVYTPALAWQTGTADKLCAIVRSCQEKFADNEQYLAVGAAYSLAGPALLMVRSGQYDEAAAELIQLDNLPEKESPDSFIFIAYGLVRAALDSGCHYLDVGRHQEAEKILLFVLPLVPDFPSLQEQLLAMLAEEDAYDDADRVAVAVNCLTELHRTAVSDEISRALSSVLTRQVILQHSAGATPGDVLLQTIKKAVELNPEDAFARMTLDDIRADLEIAEMRQAVIDGKLARAAGIAEKSRYPQVNEQFFHFAAQVVEQIAAGDYPDPETAVLLLRQLLEHVLQLNPAHAVVQEVECLLYDLEDQLEF
ncbi:MAG: hypothetical protein ACL93V_14760 [Candidatus Electrothrix sp. YB6]